MSNSKAILIIADSERDSNMYYATGFMAPDPFVYIQKDTENIMITSDLELDRARSQSKADKVLSLSKYERIIKKRRGTPSGLIGVVVARGDEIILHLIKSGLDGIEIVHPKINDRRMTRLQKIVQNHGLLVSGGSDCHDRAAPSGQ